MSKSYDFFPFRLIVASGNTLLGESNVNLDEKEFFFLRFSVSRHTNGSISTCSSAQKSFRPYECLAFYALLSLMEITTVNGLNAIDIMICTKFRFGRFPKYRMKISGSFHWVFRFSVTGPNYQMNMIMGKRNTPEFRQDCACYKWMILFVQTRVSFRFCLSKKIPIHPIHLRFANYLRTVQSINWLSPWIFIVHNARAAIPVTTVMTWLLW